MTITLNAPYAAFAGGASVDLDNATEAALVAQGRAVYTSNPGAVFIPLTPTEQQALRDSVSFTQALASGSVNRVSTTRSPVVLYEGDSITARAETTATNPVPGGFPATGNTFPSTLPTGNISGGYQDVGYTAWERILSGGVYSYRNNGVSGNTIQQIRARLLLTDLTSYDVVSVMCGMNNVSASYTTAALGVAGAVSDFADIVLMVAYVGAANKALRIITFPPRDTTGWPQSGQSPYWRKLNALIKALPQTYPWVFVADGARAYQDTAQAEASPIANSVAESGLFTAGGTHPSKLGAYLIAGVTLPSLLNALTWAGFSQIIAGRKTIDLGGTEQLTNTDFVTQTGGTVPAGALTGTIPSGWRVISAVAVTSTFPWYVPEATRQRGNWVTSTAYAVGDGVTNSGGAYLCQVAHTSGAFATDLAAGSWIRVWASEYCWQVDFTATAADQALTIQRATAPSFVASDVVVSGGYAATESSANVKRIGMEFLANLADAPSFTITLNDLGTQLMNGVTQSVTGRIEGLLCTPKGALCAGSPNGFVTNLPNWKLALTSVGAGTVTAIIYKPFFRKY